MADTKSLVTFRLLPVEMREEIFKYTFATSQNYPDFAASTPALLVALRGDRELYDQALRVFYGINHWFLTARNFQGVSALGKFAVACIRSLTIFVDDWFEDDVEFREFLQDPKGNLARAESIQTLRFYIESYRDLVSLQLIRHLVASFPRLKRLEFHEHCTSEKDSGLHLIDQVNCLFWCKAKLEEVGTSEGYDVISNDWFWEEENGDVLQRAL